MFSANYIALCAEHGVGPTSLAVQLGYTNAAGSKWINGSIPRKPALLKIANYFGVSVDDLLNADLSGQTKNGPTVSDEAAQIAQQYMKLDAYSKKAVKSLIAIESERSKASQDDAEPTEPAPVEYIRHYFTQAAAGYAAPIDGEDYELIERDAVVPKQADYCIEVAGDSMEPFIKNGQRVYVQRTVNIAEFQPAVWFVDGNVFIKQWCVDANRTLYLLSANPAREDANITIPRDSDRNVVCLGRVLLNKKLPEPTYY